MKYKQSILFSTNVLIVFSLASCSSLKEASQNNFKNAINQYFATHPSCFQLSQNKFPHYTGVSSRGRTLSNGGDGKMYDAMLAAGMLKAETKETQLGGGFGFVEVTQKIELSEEGSREFSVNKGFCYGFREVIDIKNFTEPTPSEKLGGKISKVVYTYRIKDKKFWVDKLPLSSFSYGEIHGQTELYELFQDAPALSGTAEDEASLVLTEKGWVDSREISSSR